MKFLKDWLEKRGDAIKRLESATQSLERSIGRLDHIIEKAKIDTSNDMKQKSEKLREELDEISGR